MTRTERRTRLAVIARALTVILPELGAILRYHRGADVATQHTDAVREAVHRALDAGGAYDTAGDDHA